MSFIQIYTELKKQTWQHHVIHTIYVMTFIACHPCQVMHAFHSYPDICWVEGTDMDGIMSFISFVMTYISWQMCHVIDVMTCYTCYVCTHVMMHATTTATSRCRRLDRYAQITWSSQRMLLIKIADKHGARKAWRGPGELRCIGESVAEVMCLLAKECWDWWSKQQCCHSNVASFS